MTTLILHATPFAGPVATALRAFYLRFCDALDALVEVRVRHAVPEYELRRARREIERYQRLMHADHKPAARRKRSGR